MKKNLKNILLLLGVGLMIPMLAAHASEKVNFDNIESVMIWKRTDIVLTSEKEYENPYKDVDVDAVFTHESGESIHLYGFWNGGNEWRVRFAPTKTGVWTYLITCSDASNASLNGVTGSLLAVENTGTTDVDRHGFVKISENGRYFVHDDGTPFYWLGDTNWQAPNYVSVTKCNYPGCVCGNQFKHEVDDRVAKGFTVYQTYFDSGESDGGGQRSTTNEPGLWLSKYDLPDTASFSGKIDGMFDYLAERGMVVALGFGVHANTVQAMGVEALERFSRYLTARYAAYPVVWITAQEITGPEHFDAWLSSARIVSAGDGYNHPQSAHQYPLPVENEFVERLDSESWHSFYALQGGHGGLISAKSLYEGYWNNTRAGSAKPFVETEANYEDITCGAFNGYSASRISAWKANLCGSYGFTYGVTGVWANNYSTAGNTGWFGSYSFEPWYMGIDKPGSLEMKYLAAFFKYADFSRLVPRFNNEAFSDLTAETKAVASSDNADTYVAYFYNRDLSTGELRGLDPAAQYSAKWYNPLTGCFVEIPGMITAEDGRYTIPEKPTPGDWALLVTSRTDLGGYVTEKAYTDERLTLTRTAESAVLVSNEKGANILSGSSVTASSFSTEESNASKSIDGDFDTWWCASDGSFPQILCYKLPEERTFNTFSMNLYRGTSSAGYTLEISNDGKNWTEVYSCDDEIAQAFGSTSSFTCLLPHEYTCRHLRVTFSKVVGNWAAVVDAAAYMSGFSGSLPEYAGTKQLPQVKCTGSYVYDADGNGTDTVSNLFDGDVNTLWVPFAPIASQTITMDLGSSSPLHGINIRVDADAIIPEYRIEGSADGLVWTVLADATIRDRNVFESGGQRVVSEPLSGEYRYVKLLWLNVGSNNADKSISEIELYAGENASQPSGDPSGCGKLTAAVLIGAGSLAVAGAAVATAVCIKKKRGT
ncbi:MAG: DUF4038 domain-containing protein [Clostridia bacterium]|nr:DUF4038 domain-containing protein [Clostridia bacterium]